MLLLPLVVADSTAQHLLLVLVLLHAAAAAGHGRWTEVLPLRAAAAVEQLLLVLLRAANDLSRNLPMGCWGLHHSRTHCRLPAQLPRALRVGHAGRRAGSDQLQSVFAAAQVPRLAPAAPAQVAPIAVALARLVEPLAPGPEAGAAVMAPVVQLMAPGPEVGAEPLVLATAVAVALMAQGPEAGAAEVVAALAPLPAAQLLVALTAVDLEVKPSSRPGQP